MEPRPLNFIASACEGTPLNGTADLPVSRVCTDSRAVQPGDLFVALVGDRFDGHDFLQDAIGKGAAALLLEHRRTPARLPDCGVIAVSDTRRALGQLAGEYRKDFNLPVVAVGGSNGKTSTKDLIAAVLRQKLQTVASEASFNNDIGVPLTLLKLERRHQAAVLEVGTNHPGELEPLLRLVRPQYGVLTSIGREHLEFFENIAGVVREEGYLAEMLPANGKLFFNGDNEWVGAIRERTRATAVRVGAGTGNDWRLRSLRMDRQGTTFRIEAPLLDFAGEYRSRLLGRHQAVNSLFAIALGVEFGLSRDEIQRGLAECKPAKMRLELLEANGVRILDDTYNANADSMTAALETAQALSCRGRRVAVLGDMAELGAQSEAAHEEVGRRAAELGIGQLFAVGKMASVMARGARGEGLNRVLEFADVEAAALAVKQFVRSGDLVLLKGSRVMRLERITERLRAAETGQKNLAALCY